MLALCHSDSFISKLGNTWKEPLKDLIATFTAQTETLGVLLILVGVLPEESMNQVSFCFRHILLRYRFVHFSSC